MSTVTGSAFCNHYSPINLYCILDVGYQNEIIHSFRLFLSACFLLLLVLNHHTGNLGTKARNVVTDPVGFQGETGHQSATNPFTSGWSPFPFPVR